MKKTIVYKLTDNIGRTRGMTQWGNNVSHTAKGDGKELCSNGFIHYYTHPLLAVLLNPIHADFTYPKLWEAEASGEIIDEALKSVCKTLTTIKEIPLPEISGVQKIAFGILCAKEVCKDERWNSWADKWLSGKDRSNESANAAHVVYAADYNIINASAYVAAYASAYASAFAASVMIYANNYAVCSAAANAAANAAYDDFDKSIDFIALAEKAMTYK